MKFAEISTQQFTSATTCYSGLSEVSQTKENDEYNGFMATGHHLVQCHFPAHTSDGDNIRITSNHAFPVSKICVGSSSVTKSANNGSSIVVHALAFLHTKALENEPSYSDLYSLYTYDPNTSLHNNPNASFEDTSTVASTAAESQSTVPWGNLTTYNNLNASIRSLTTNDGGRTVTNASTTTSVSTATGKSGESVSAPMPSEASPLPTNQHQDVGELAVYVSDDKYIQRSLSFRPVSPCAMILSSTTGGIWLGSSTDAQLRLYTWSLDCSSSLEMHEQLPSSHFQFDSSVLAIGSCVVDERLVLVVAGADGTIRTLSWVGGLTFGKISSKNILVDGPLCCLKVHPYTVDSLRNVSVLVGSLTGYVCQVCGRQRQDDDNISWDEPRVVVQNLRRNQTLGILEQQRYGKEEEDSVLAVSYLPDFRLVAVGTHGGRVAVYSEVLRDSRKSVWGVETPEYFCAWECILPYAIHELALFMSNGRLNFLATTRRAIHWFQSDMASGHWERKQCVKQAKELVDPEKIKMQLAALRRQLGEKRVKIQADRAALVEQAQQEALSRATELVLKVEPSVEDDVDVAEDLGDDILRGESILEDDSQVSEQKSETEVRLASSQQVNSPSDAPMPSETDSTQEAVSQETVRGGIDFSALSVEEGNLPDNLVSSEGDGAEAFAEEKSPDGVSASVSAVEENASALAQSVEQLQEDAQLVIQPEPPTTEINANGAAPDDVDAEDIEDNAGWEVIDQSSAHPEEL